MPPLLSILLSACAPEPARPEDACIARPLADIGSILELDCALAGDPAVDIEYRVRGEAWRTARRLTGRQLLLGMPYDATVDWRLRDDGAIIASGSADTMPLPDGFPEPALIIDDPMQMSSQDRYLLGSIKEGQNQWVDDLFWTFILDRQGRVVWARQNPEGTWALYPQQSLDGESLLIDHSTLYARVDEGQQSTILRIGLDGDVRETIDTPGLYHAFDQMPDGSLAWTDGSRTLFDILVVRSPDGTINDLWRCAPWVEANPPGELIPFANSSCRSNTIFYDEDRDTLMVSFYSSSTVLEVDRQTGAEQWHAGILTNGYTFAPADAQFLFQHGAHWTDAGTLMVSTKDLAETELRVYEYAVDEDAGTLSLVWSYGVDEGVFGNLAGEAWVLDNGNVLHNYGVGALVKEVTRTGEVVWRVDWEPDHLLGHTTFLTGDLYDLVR
ncbi:MAG: aryl-sulfate sulfotransferase [Myxococcota bacterium]